MGAVPGFEQQRHNFRAVGPRMPDVLAALRIERSALLVALGGLAADEWRKATTCPGWTVHDLVLHVLGGDLGALAMLRDGHWAGVETGAGRSLAEAIDELNATWLAAAGGRFSPRMLEGLLEWSGRETLQFFASVSGEAPSPLGVSWAGTAPSPHGLEVARQYTERWLHHQQLRSAVGRPPFDDPVGRKVLVQSLAHCLPVAYAAVAAPDGTTVRLDVTDLPTLQLGLGREAGAWHLISSRDLGEATCSVTVPSEPLWRAWTTNGDPAALEAAATIAGAADLAPPLWTARAVISTRP